MGSTFTKKSLCLVEVHDGEKVDRHHVYSSDFTIGRGEDVDVYIHSPAVSRHHFKVSVMDKTLWITDLGSSNGTKISTCEVGKNARIIYAPGEPIRFGDKTIYVVIHLFQTPMDRHETAEDILQDAFKSAEELKRSAIEEAKEIVQVEARALREAAQKQIDQSMHEGLKRAAERATQFEKARREKAETEVQMILDETRVRGQKEIDAQKNTARIESDRQRADLLKLAEQECTQTIAQSRRAAATLLNRARTQRAKLKQQFVSRSSAHQFAIEELRQKQIQLEEAAMRSQVKADLAQKASEKLTLELQDLERESIQKQQSFSLQKSEMDREVQLSVQKLDELKLHHSKLALEMNEVEATTVKLREQGRMSEDKLRKIYLETEVKKQELVTLQAEFLQTQQGLQEQERKLNCALVEHKNKLDADLDKARAQADLLLRKAKTEAQTEKDRGQEQLVKWRADHALDLQADRVRANEAMLKQKLDFEAEFKLLSQGTSAAISQEIEQHLLLKFRLNLDATTTDELRREITGTVTSQFESVFIQSQLKSIQNERTLTAIHQRPRALRGPKLRRGAMTLVVALAVGTGVWQLRERLSSSRSDLAQKNSRKPVVKAGTGTEDLLHHPEFLKFLKEPKNQEKWNQDIREFFTEEMRLPTKDVEKFIGINDQLIAKTVGFHTLGPLDTKRPMAADKLKEEEIRLRIQMIATLKDESKFNEFKAFERRYFSHIFDETRAPAQIK